MPVRQYYQCLTHINAEEIPYLPGGRPGSNNTQNVLSPDELTDIVLFGTPKSWQREMDCQGFDPMVKTTLEVVTFMERLEASETAADKTSNPPGKKSKTSSKPNTPSSKATGTKHCKLHGQCSHTTDECKKLKSLKDKKSWSDKAKSNQDKAKKDLAAFIKSTIQSELASVDKKRPAADLHAVDADSIEDEAFAEVDKQLANIDFKGINLDDEEISV